MKYGRNRSPANRRTLKLSDYVDLSVVLPKVPANFGHYGQVKNYGMLGNDQYGDCVWAGAAHESITWNAANNRAVSYTDAGVLSDYSAVTGFDPRDPNSDQGTDMHAAALYRQKTGIVDSTGTRHKVGAFLELKAGNLDELAAAAYLFGAVGIGIVVRSWAEQQFAQGQPWSYRIGGQILGGHYVPVVGRAVNYWDVVTWGKVQRMTESFYQVESDEAFVYLSDDYLTGTKSPEGFDRTALVSDLAALKNLK